MIDLSKMTAGTKNLPIIGWKVVFVLPPFGVYLNLDEAVAKAVEQNMDPTLFIVPSAAVMTESEMELVLR